MLNVAKKQQPWKLGKLEQLFRQTSLFKWSIFGGHSDRSLRPIQDSWRGLASEGSRIINNSSSWRNDSRGFDNFEWLRDLRASGGSSARSRARYLISSWIQQNTNWHMQRWQPDIMGKRLANLIFCFDWYGPSATEDFQLKLTNSILFQARCLALDWRRLFNPTAKISALKGLFIAEVGLGATTGDLDALLKIILPIVDEVLWLDGGHKSRMPDRHLLLMRDLIEIRNVGSTSGSKAIKELDQKIAKMNSICRIWRHVDGQFARFNGAGLITTKTIEETLARAGQRGRVLQQAPDSGFVRFSSGRSTIIMDSGSPNISADIVGFGILSFEFSVGNSLLVVNPGQTSRDSNLKRLLCSTNAHSTLTIDGANSSSPSNNRLAKITKTEIGSAEGGLLAAISHDGYEPSHGILHRRKIFLANGGSNLRGADNLEYTGAPGEIPRLAIVRFHLHPKVSAALLHDQRVLLKIRGNRTGWVFRSNVATTLDNSLFFDGLTRANSRQIVLKFALSDLRTVGNAEIKWAFTRSSTD